MRRVVLKGLYGAVKPTGKLSHSWPKLDFQPNIHAAGYTPLFALKFGLTYP